MTRSLLAKIILCSLTLLAAITIGCRGSENPDRLEKGLFEGFWRLNYDVLVDECGLVPEGANAFNDTQNVTQTGDLIVVQSSNLSENDYIGEVREDGSFEAETSATGDLFGDGVNCSLVENLAYTNTTSQESASLYDLRLRCDDGFYCVSALRGTGVRGQG